LSVKIGVIPHALSKRRHELADIVCNADVLSWRQSKPTRTVRMGP